MVVCLWWRKKLLMLPGFIQYPDQGLKVLLKVLSPWVYISVASFVLYAVGKPHQVIIITSVYATTILLWVRSEISSLFQASVRSHWLFQLRNSPEKNTMALLFWFWLLLFIFLSMFCSQIPLSLLRMSSSNSHSSFLCYLWVTSVAKFNLMQPVS